MKKFIQIAGPLYVIFALFMAHTTMVAYEATVATSSNERPEVATSIQLVRDNQRVDYKDTSIPAEEKAKYQVVVWTASWCRPCSAYKSLEIPRLISLGYTVVVKDIDQEKCPKEVVQIPTVRLFYKGDFIRQQTYWRAYDLDRFVEGRMSLKKNDS